jgi:CheY-like chemotaxis protein/AraC-like DNA-binding protein
VARATRSTILSVDDEPGILEAIRLELEHGFDVVTATDGPEALDVLMHHHVDAMLLDLRMPKMDGEEVLRRLRAARSRLPVIVMTVVSEPKTVVECMKLGAADYLTKPWECGEPSATVQRILREVDAGPRVLLVSDDPVALVPVQLALEAHVRVATLSTAGAYSSDCPTLVLVLHARFPALSALPARFPHVPVVWVDEDPTVGTEPVVPLHRLDLVLSSIGKLLRIPTLRRCHVSRTLMAAVHLMANNYRVPLTIDEIAGRVGLSPDHLIRVFREAFGLPAATYYMRLRIAVACRLLRNTETKMNTIAHQIGYSGAETFSRAFKGVMGVRPGEYRSSSI